LRVLGVELALREIIPKHLDPQQLFPASASSFPGQ
jgi:hypothetical protein